MLVIYSGDVGIFLSTTKELQKITRRNRMVALKQNGSIIGEIGLLTSQERNASCVALSNVKAMMLSKADYKEIIENFHKFEWYQNIQFNTKLDIFKHINYTQIEKIAAAYNHDFVKKNDVIVWAGQVLDQVYIIK